MRSQLAVFLGLALLAAAEDGAGPLATSQQPLSGLDSRDVAQPVLVLEVADVPALVEYSLLTPHARFAQQGAAAATLQASLAQITGNLEQATGLSAAEVQQTLSDIQAFRISMTPLRNGEPLGRFEGSLTVRFTDLDAALATFLRINSTTEESSSVASALQEGRSQAIFQGVFEKVLFERNGQLLSVRPLAATLSDTPFELEAHGSATTDNSTDGSEAKPSKGPGGVASAIRARVLPGGMLPAFRQQLARDLPAGFSTELLETVIGSFEALVHWDVGEFGLSELISGEVDEARLRAIDWEASSAALLEGLRTVGALDDNDIRAIEELEDEAKEQAPPIAPPPLTPVDRSVLEQLPADTLMAAAWTMRGAPNQEEFAKRAFKISNAVQQSPLHNGPNAALAERMQELWARVLLSCDGQANAYVRSGLGLPTVTLALPLGNETLATEVAELLVAELPNAVVAGPDVEVASNGVTLSIGWRKGAGLIATTHPLGVESHIGNTGGFLSDPELQALLEADVAPADQTSFLALSRGAPVVAAVAPLASMMGLVPPSALSALQKAMVPGFLEGRIDGTVRSQGIVTLALFPLSGGVAAAFAPQRQATPKQPAMHHDSAEL